MSNTRLAATVVGTEPWKCAPRPTLERARCMDITVTKVALTRNLRAAKGALVARAPLSLLIGPSKREYRPLCAVTVMARVRLLPQSDGF
jgi:hypothetical protein